MWRLMHFAVAFHAQREGDGDAGRLAEQASFGRDAGKRMRWVLFGRGLPRIALLQVTGSAPQLIPSQTTGTRACHSTCVTAQWQKMPGTLAVVPLQSPGSCSVLVVSLVPPSQPDAVPAPGCVGAEEGACAGVLLPPCPPWGRGCKRLRVPSVLGPWVGFARRRALRDLKT